MKKRFPIIIITVCTLVLLSGCVNLVQEVTITEDGSGALRFAIGVETASYAQFRERIPEEYQLENFFAAFSEDENITGVAQDQYVAGGRTWDAIELQVADFTQLFAEERRIGPIAISLDQADDGNYIFSQTIDLPSSNLQIPGINLMDLSGAGYTVRLITPQIVNTTGFQPAVGVSEWEVPLSEMVQGGEVVYLQAEYALEPFEGMFIPWEVFYPYVVIGFLSMGVLAILVVIILNTRKKRDQIDQIKF